MLLLVCGSRNWTDEQLIMQVLGGLPKDTVVMHGGAYGADTAAGNVAAVIGLTVIVVNAEWNKYGKSAGFIRNQKMIDRKPDKVIAFMCTPATRGTSDTIARAKVAGIPVEVYKER